MLLSGDWERAERVNDELARTRSGYPAGITLYNAGWTRAARGRLQSAVRDMREAGSRLSDSNLASLGALYTLSAAGILEAAGRLDQAISVAREAIEIDPLAPLPHVSHGRLLYRAGRTDEATEVLDRLRRMAAEVPSPLTRYAVHLLEAEIALRSGNLQAAEQAIERARSFPVAQRTPVIDGSILGRVRSEAGDTRGALAAYETILQPRARYDLDVVRDTLAHYELGRLSEELGQRAAAREHYEAFLARWGNADLPIPQVAEARSRLAALD
jgi:tetratricopeptide (TPR) repeat protein